MTFCLAHYLYMCVMCVNTCVHIRVYIHIVLKICSGSSHASHLDTTIKIDWLNFFSSVIPRVTVSHLKFLPVNHNYHKTTLDHMVPYGW